MDLAPSVSEDDGGHSGHNGKRRLKAGPVPRGDVVIHPETEELVRLVRSNKSIELIDRFLFEVVAERTDAELEALVPIVMELDVDVGKFVEVQAAAKRGDTQLALRLLVVRLKQRVRAMLRDAQRAEDDAFLDSCVVE